MKKLLEASPALPLELLVVTHVDSDHIAGALRLFEDSALVRRFRDIWFNGFKHLVPAGMEALGPKQGDRLTEAIERFRLPWNEAFGGKAVSLGDGDAPVARELAGGARIMLLSPSPTHLKMLRHVWALTVVGEGLVDKGIRPKTRTLVKTRDPD